VWFALKSVGTRLICLPKELISVSSTRLMKFEELLSVAQKKSLARRNSQKTTGCYISTRRAQYWMRKNLPILSAPFAPYKVTIKQQKLKHTKLSLSLSLSLCDTFHQQRNLSLDIEFTTIKLFQTSSSKIPVRQEA